MFNWIKKMVNDPLDLSINRFAQDAMLRKDLQRRLNFLAQQIEVIKGRQDDASNS